jgi:phenylalanyl-tRNA synthetase beta chain
MRAPLSWLQSLTPLPARATDRPSVAELTSELDALGLVVEGIELVGEGLDDVVVAQVLEISAIAGADRIRRVVVEVGDGQTLEVVCGAWNFEVGDVVPFVPAGGVLPGEFRIERRKMKGVVSNGMICSARELHLGDDHEGIMVLARPDRPSTSGGRVAPGPPAGMELGRPLADALGIGPDVVFDLAIEANRPDCLCMLGVARDLAARYHLPLHLPAPVVAESQPDAAELASVEVAEARLCRRLTARVMTGISIVPSPPWLQRRLTLAGMRPIDCVVDASNYVMLELGQPTHPYDLDGLGGHGLRVRAAHPGETIVTLDGVARILGARPARRDDPVTALDCLICNANDIPVGIGGIMGGRSSEISPSTTQVLLEAAEFEPTAVARTARYLGLRTEASVRFERGVDPEAIDRAADRVCELVVEAAGAAGVPPPVVARGLLDDRPVKTERRRIEVRPSRVNKLLGTELETPQMLALLEPVGFRPLDTSNGATGHEVAPSADPPAERPLALEIPPWRPDVSAEVDVTEEVARMYGYRKIMPTNRRSPHVGRLDPVQALRRRLRRILCGLGAHEAWTPSIIDPADDDRAGGVGELVRLANPMVAEEVALRADLLGGLLGALRYNSGHRHPSIRLFEMGEVFSPAGLMDGSGDSTGDGQGATGLPGDGQGATGLPGEREVVALVLGRDGDDAASAVSAWRVVADALGIVGIELHQPAPQAWVANDEGSVPDDELGPSETNPLEIAPQELTALSGLHPTRSGILVVGDAAAGPGGALTQDRPAADELKSGLGAEPGAPGAVGLAGIPAASPGTLLGVVGEVDPDVVAAFGLPHARVGWLELDLGVLSMAPRRPLVAAPVSRYPSGDVDLAFVVDESTPAWRVEETLRLAAGTRLESVELFDVYRGPGVGEGQRSLGFRLRFSALDHTLTEAELGELRRRGIDAVEAALPASLRT